MPLKENKVKRANRLFFVTIENLVSKNHFPVSLLFVLLSEQASHIHLLNELLDFHLFARLNCDSINVFDRRIILNIH